MHSQVLLGLGIRHAALLDQPHRLKLEFSRKLPPLHDAPPVPLKHLTWCLRNRVQANIKDGQPELDWEYSETFLELCKQCCKELYAHRQVAIDAANARRAEERRLREEVE